MTVSLSARSMYRPVQISNQIVSIIYKSFWRELSPMTWEITIRLVKDNVFMPKKNIHVELAILHNKNVFLNKNHKKMKLPWHYRIDLQIEMNNDFFPLEKGYYLINDKVEWLPLRIAESPRQRHDACATSQPTNQSNKESHWNKILFLIVELYNSI